MCSSTLSDPANRLRKTRKKKSSAVLLISERSHIGNLRQIRKQGKGRSSKRKGNRRLSFLFAPAAGAARSRRPQTANPPPLRFSEKLSARQGRTRLRQFACPAQPAQKRSRPSGSNPPAAVRVPRSAGAAKGAARIGRTRLRQFVCPGHLVPRKEKHRRIASTVLKVCTFTQIVAAYRHPYAPAPAGPVPDDRAR